jgi:hypothetical protein
MSSTRASKATKPKINYHRLSLGDSQLFELDALLTRDQNANHQTGQSPQSSSTYTDRRLTTPQFVSALTGIWSLIGETESSCTTQNSKSNGTSNRDDPVCFSRDRQGHILSPFYAATPSGLISQNCSSTPKLIYEDLSSVKKMLMLTPFSSVVAASSTWRRMCLVNKVEGGHFLQFANLYCMQCERTGKVATFEISERSLSKETYSASTNMAIRNDNYSSQPRSMPAELCTIPNEETNTTHDCESSLHNTKSNLEIFQEDTVLSVCSVQQMEIVEEAQLSSKACKEVQLHALTCTPSLVDDAVVDSTNADRNDYVDDVYKEHSVGKCSRELQVTFQHQCDSTVTVNRHAVAGALSGSVVSISFHPVDTVKTLIQANRSGQSSFYHTLRHILIEKGKFNGNSIQKLSFVSVYSCTLRNVNYHIIF